MHSERQLFAHQGPIHQAVSGALFELRLKDTGNRESGEQ